ncbi:MAG: energy-coupling factor ABC transporter permease [Kangiellaceae bacterium]|jgi:uncharacterized membrane protein|nr:energy-coupling factor ABC transporter permease [Kangiellaceae bacterium]
MATIVLIDYSTSFYLYLWLFNAVSGMILLVSLKSAQWRHLIEVPLRQHLVLGCSALVSIMWLMKFQVISNIYLHPIAIGCVALMIGFRFALIAGAIANFIFLMVTDLSLLNFGAHWLINVVFPALFIVLLNHWVHKKHPSNLFFYTLGIGFLGSALTVPIVVLLSFALLVMSGNLANQTNMDWQSQWLLLAMFPEAFINGAIVSSITVFYPEWMKTFDEDYFLSK